MSKHGKPVAAVILGLGSALAWMAFASAASHAAVPGPTCGSSSPVTVPGVVECSTTTTAPKTTTTTAPASTTPATKAAAVPASDVTAPPDTTPTTLAPSPPSQLVPAPSAVPEQPVLAQQSAGQSAAPVNQSSARTVTPALAFGGPSGFAYPIVLAFPLILLIAGGYFAWVLTRPVTPPRG